VDGEPVGAVVTLIVAVLFELPGWVKG